MLMIYKKMTILTIIMITLLFFLWQNNHITLSQTDYINSKIPKEFSGYKIVQISDLHNKRFGKDQKRLLEKIERLSPHIIVVTGDLIDRRRYDLDIAMTFIQGAIKIAPVYYVSGNHEAWSNHYKDISNRLVSCGVRILDDDKAELVKDDGRIEILGLSDPAFSTSNYTDGIDMSKLEKHLTNLCQDSIFQILFCHRPELFDLYADKDIDLIFTGHAHGGQFRIPFIGGLIAPGQGIFPKYTNGSYEQKKSTMFVSRGLGNSIIPFRIFNRPEIVVVTLQSQ